MQGTYVNFNNIYNKQFSTCHRDVFEVICILYMFNLDIFPASILLYNFIETYYYNSKHLYKNVHILS